MLGKLLGECVDGREGLDRLTDSWRICYCRSSNSCVAPSSSIKGEERMRKDNRFVGELILDKQSLISGVSANGRQYLGSVDEVGRDSCVICSFPYTILATYEENRRPTSVYRRGLSRTLDVIK